MKTETPTTTTWNLKISKKKQKKEQNKNKTLEWTLLFAAFSKQFWCCMEFFLFFFLFSHPESLFDDLLLSFSFFFSSLLFFFSFFYFCFLLIQCDCFYLKLGVTEVSIIRWTFICFTMKFSTLFYNSTALSALSVCCKTPYISTSTWCEVHYVCGTFKPSNNCTVLIHLSLIILINLGQLFD